MSPGGAVARRRARLMLVDDHDIVRHGLRCLIQDFPDWTVCAEAGGGEEALRLAAETRPDIVVLDLSMPCIGGAEIIAPLKALLPGVEILVMTMHDSKRLMGEALRAGARGYVLKSDGGEKFVEALAALARHQPYVSAAVSEALLQLYLDPSVGGAEQLTRRERQVVKLVAEGNSNKQIARILVVSIKTVEAHRAAAMRKIGAKSSADLAIYAARNGLVQL